MRRGKKLILIALLTLVVLAGTIGGVALANDDEDDNQPKARHGTLLDKVCEIYNANPDRTGDIDPDLLRDAFTEAGNQIREEARHQFRQRLLDEDMFTEDQLSELEEWMKSRPDFKTEEFKEWMKARPDIPFDFGPRSRGGFKSFGGFGKFGGRFRSFCESGETAE